jgi:hypothetical protein
MTGPAPEYMSNPATSQSEGFIADSQRLVKPDEPFRDSVILTSDFNLQNLKPLIIAKQFTFNELLERVRPDVFAIYEPDLNEFDSCCRELRPLLLAGRVSGYRYGARVGL